MVVRYIETTVASAARILPWIPLNLHEAESPVRWMVNKTGNGSYAAEVQITLDNVLDTTVSALAYNIQTINVSATSNTFNVPVAAVRLSIVSASGHNSISFRMIQAGR